MAYDPEGLRKRDWERMRLAARLGPMACLRLRAEVLLNRGNRAEVPITFREREVLERIAAAPKEEDREFLGGFDKYLEEGDE